MTSKYNPKIKPHAMAYHDVSSYVESLLEEIEDWRRLAGELAAECTAYRVTLDILANDGSTTAVSPAEYRYLKKIEEAE